MTLKNRGAFSNPEGRFETQSRESFDDGWEKEEDILPILETTLLPEYAKSIITYNDSPDIGFDASINPYRGCEHGCIYCYARPSHAYMNLSPGLDFETKIFHKVDAAKLLLNEFKKKNYQCETIIIGANTDPYQPAESKLKITRQLLDVMQQYHHPVAIITKSSLIERDIDILAAMAARNLASVAITVTTLSLELKHILEPRTSAPNARIRTIRKLRENGIPVRVMAAPMIPMINDKELEKILAAASDAGAEYAGYTLIRLPYELKQLFKEWLQNHFPNRALHVMSIIKQMRGGKEYDATFGKRMKGEGEFANLLAMRFKLACKRFNLNQKSSIQLDTTQFIKPKENNSQFELF